MMHKKNLLIAKKIEEVADALTREADNLTRKAAWVREGKIHHANEAVGNICNLHTLVNLNGLISAIIEGEKK